MKLILAIVKAEAVDSVTRALIERRYSVTQVSSMGGFLRRGSATLVIGVKESQVQDVLALLRQLGAGQSTADAHCVTVFVVDASQFVQI